MKKQGTTGRAWRVGDDFSTDLIYPSRYLDITEPSEMAKHCMERAIPEFGRAVRAGDIVAAGKNFGYGSSREQAPMSLMSCGVACVVAPSFARIFYRNAVNNGLRVAEADTASIRDGDQLEIDWDAHVLRNLTTGTDVSIQPPQGFADDLLAHGGLIPFIEEQLTKREASAE